MTMVDFSRFFRPKETGDDAEDAERINRINEILDFSQTAYFPKLVEWLEKEANKPLAVGDHMQMIQSAVRANTLREIRDTLVKRVKSARDAAAETEE